MEIIANVSGIALVAAYFWLIIVGALWTPFAALICLAVARVRRLDGDGWGKAGALYSLTFFLPWVWLVLRMAGVPIPAVVTRAGYALLYGLWLLACVFLVIGGAFSAAGITTDELRPDYAIALSAGLFAGAVWFASLRRTLRLRPAPEGDEMREDEIIIPAPPSVPMRVAYVAMHVSWTLGTLGMLAQGIFEYATFGGRLDSAIPLWIGGVLFALVQAAALKEYGWKTADRWDSPRPTRRRMPPDNAYFAPFLLLLLLIAVPAGVALVGWILGIILWLSYGAR